MSLFVIFKFPASSVPRMSQHSQRTEPRRQMPASAGRHCPGTLQEGHRGSAGQGKRRTDPGAAPHGIPECSSGLPLVLHSGIPPGRL
ncbi:unnamed protein product, partial [Staurois parvus]